MAKFIEVLDSNGLVTSYQSCDNSDCYKAVITKAKGRLGVGQYLNVSSFASDDDCCDNFETRLSHYLDSNKLALSDREIEGLY